VQSNNPPAEPQPGSVGVWQRFATNWAIAALKPVSTAFRQGRLRFRSNDWSPIQPQVNAVAIATGTGIVQSAYPCRGIYGAHHEHIEFITFHDPPNETLIVSQRHDI
jgi:hypothetical protein